MADMEEQVTSIVLGMKRKGINFVAIDFDLTLVSVHAGGDDWQGSVADLQVSAFEFLYRLRSDVSLILLCLRNV
jgi:hypothetical protein